jgi:hypothetical protein
VLVGVGKGERRRGAYVAAVDSLDGVDEDLGGMSACAGGERGLPGLTIMLLLDD